MRAMNRNLRRTIGAAGAFVLLAAKTLAQSGIAAKPAPPQANPPAQAAPAPQQQPPRLQQPPPAPTPAPTPPPQQQPPAAQPGGPLTGLTAAETALYNAGRAQFLQAETAASGLGPIFNNDSCVSCHGRPAPGGSSQIAITRFGRTVNGVFDPLESTGGSLLQNRAIDPAVREVIPREANTVAQRQTPPLFGLGLIEAVPDSAIQALALRPAVDGITGRAAMVTDVVSGSRRVGRFGMKAQHATILAFTADAYANEMGITNRFFPHENAPNGNTALLAAFDRTQDPEDVVNPVTSRADVDSVADYQRLLAAPQPLAFTARATAGQKVFSDIGCAICHVPQLTTGANSVAALSNKAVNLYSDLLLHDMGALGDGIAQSAATAREMRTTPLWGLRFSGPYLHDGRATTVDAAVRGHDGQGRASRDRYAALSATDSAALLEFLNSL